MSAGSSPASLSSTRCAPADQAASGHVRVDDLAAGVHTGVGAAATVSFGGAGSRSTRASAAATTSSTMRLPGWAAHPENPDPS